MLLLAIRILDDLQHICPSRVSIPVLANNRNIAKKADGLASHSSHGRSSKLSLRAMDVLFLLISFLFDVRGDHTSGFRTPKDSLSEGGRDRGSDEKANSSMLQHLRVIWCFMAVLGFDRHCPSIGRTFLAL